MARQALPCLVRNTALQSCLAIKTTRCCPGRASTPTGGTAALQPHTSAPVSQHTAAQHTARTSSCWRPKQTFQLLLTQPGLSKGPWSPERVPSMAGAPCSTEASMQRHSCPWAVLACVAEHCLQAGKCYLQTMSTELGAPACRFYTQTCLQLSPGNNRKPSGAVLTSERAFGSPHVWAAWCPSAGQELQQTSV